MKYLIVLCTIAIVLCTMAIVFQIDLQEGFRARSSSSSAARANNGYHRSKTCNYQMISVLKHMIKANELNHNTDSNWSVYLPCGYNNSQQELQQIVPSSEDQKIFIIKGCDNLSRKDNLWESLKQEYGINEASSIMPKTYLLYRSNDLELLKREHDPHKVYIMKKNIQRQTGLLVTKDLSKMLEGYKQGYVIAQEMLQDPYLIDNRKTNCRVYLLVVCKKGEKHAYIFDDGFMYYTKKHFKPNSTNTDRIITTGYVDREIYNKNPLTLKDFDKYLTERGNPKGLLYDKAVGLLKKTMKAADKKICTKSNVINQVTFQLFGCDIAYNDKLNVSLIEINKGPNLAPHSPRDKKLKQELIDETFRKVGVLPGKATHFIKVT